jgi:HlyD family secretion protein
VVYLPTEHGKKVKTGMKAHIAPATVKKEEYGMLVGRVREVSPFPATRQGIAAVVQNDSLVDSYVKAGAPYEARLDLIVADTSSGYAWTSGAGPDVDLTSGTTVEAALTVREQRPIELVLPFLRHVLGGG